MILPPLLILFTGALILISLSLVAPAYVVIAVAIVLVMLIMVGGLLSSRMSRSSGEPQPDSASADQITAAQNYCSLIHELSDKYHGRDVYPALTYEEDLGELEIAICEDDHGEHKIIESIGSMSTFYDDKIGCFDDGRRVIYTSSPCLMPLLAHLLAEEMKKPLVFLIPPNSTAPRYTVELLVDAFRSRPESPSLPSSSVRQSILWK